MRGLLISTTSEFVPTVRTSRPNPSSICRAFSVVSAATGSSCMRSSSRKAIGCARVGYCLRSRRRFSQFGQEGFHSSGRRRLSGSKRTFMIKFTLFCTPSLACKTSSGTNAVCGGTCPLASAKRPKSASSTTRATRTRSETLPSSSPESGASLENALGFSRRSRTSSPGFTPSCAARRSFSANSFAASGTAFADGDNFQNASSTPTIWTLFARAFPSERAAVPESISTPAASTPGKNARATTCGRFSTSRDHGTKRSPQSSASPIFPTRASACARSVAFTESPTMSAPVSTSAASAEPRMTPRCVRQ